jgi:prevent-host-death family protein
LSGQRPRNGLSGGGHRDQIPASTFKARCLALLDEVERTGRPLIITKRGRPVARLEPVERPAPLSGSVTFNVDDEGLIAAIGDRWDAA